MSTVYEWLSTLRARDAMSKAVVVLHPSDRMTDAVTPFLREQISGAPVVDENGMCVGVFSATDILHFEKRANAPASGPKGRACRFDTWDAGADWWREFGRIGEEIRTQPNLRVSEFMTRDVVSVTEDTPLEVVVRYMVDAHLHRVLVLDASRRLKGIVSTMDVLAAALRAARREKVNSGGVVTHGFAQR